MRGLTGGPSAALPATDELVRVVQDPAASRDTRLDAGKRLARIGDPRAGVLTLDPRWCAVPAGTFLMGSSPADAEAFDREMPRHVVDLPAFATAQYPVTNAQWRHFVDDGGYGDAAWWPRAGWRAREAFGWEYPRRWSDTTWPGNEANRPVTGVSWYEALAFSAWLSLRLGYQVDVCTEAEWEKSARGADGRRYPFGNELDPERLHACTTHPVWTDAPAPVGCYPGGASPWGVEDMVGNTYAWTRSRWGAREDAPAFAHPYQSGDGREDLESEDYRVVRGGAWSFPLRNARCGYRGKDRPADAFDNLGVRLVTRAFTGPRLRPEDLQEE